jgi:hypothetical protein
MSAFMMDTAIESFQAQLILWRFRFDVEVGMVIAEVAL